VDLQRSFPAMAGHMLSDDGKLHRFVNVYVNDDDVRYLEKLDTKVADGDVVSILPAVAGGA
jgi:molybdopterin converting factor small subunit